MNTTSIGQRAERIVAHYLRSKGYSIAAHNWKTKTCEIDLVVCKDQVVTFVEVKYRSNLSQGSGFDYINQAKLRRMHYAAQLWVARFGWHGEYRLGAAYVNKADMVEYREL